MTETSTPPPGRTWIQYDPAEDTGEISLPGYLDAVPSVLKPGDVFSLPDAQAAEVIGGRFVEVDEPKVESANGKLTKAELAEKLGDESLESEPKADLVSLADELDRMTPPIPPAAPDVPFVPAFDAAVAEQVAEQVANDAPPAGEGDDENPGEGDDK